MGNVEICDRCESFDTLQNSTQYTRKSKSTRSISWNDGYDIRSTNPKIIKLVQDGIYEVIYPKGGFYRGEMKIQMRQGNGKLTWPGGHYYEGSWKNDKSDGKGILKTADFEFEGKFAENSIVQGRMTTFNKKNQEIYIGQFKDFMYHGKGKLTIKNQYTYQGEFQFHKKEGKGIIKHLNGHEYQGQFKRGMMDGIGAYKCPQFVFTGHFERGKMQGQGQCRWSNGTFYIGAYSKGLKEGYGEYLYEDGKTYKGLWKKGKPFQLSYTFGKKDCIDI